MSVKMISLEKEVNEERMKRETSEKLLTKTNDKMEKLHVDTTHLRETNTKVMVSVKFEPTLDDIISPFERPLTLIFVI